MSIITLVRETLKALSANQGAEPPPPTTTTGRTEPGPAALTQETSCFPVGENPLPAPPLVLGWSHMLTWRRNTHQNPRDGAQYQDLPEATGNEALG